MLILARALQHPNRRRDVNAPRDPVGSVLDALRADPNTALFKDPTQNALDSVDLKIDPRRFTAEPVPHSSLAPLDDPRRDEWREDVKREEHEDRKARAESYGSGGFGL